MLYPAESEISPKSKGSKRSGNKLLTAASPKRDIIDDPASSHIGLSQRSKSVVPGYNNNFTILSKRTKNYSNLPGDPSLHDSQPPRVDYYDVFYFETRMRDMIEEYMEPIKQSMLNDKHASIQLRFDYDCILERLYELEHFALIQDWKL